MEIADMIAEEARTLSPDTQKQVLDFVAFLKQREQAAIEADMDAILNEYSDAWKELAK